MPRQAVITETALKSLGLKRLAALVQEACDRDDVLENKVRMMLAAKDGGDALDAELSKRIKSLAGSRMFYDWRIVGDLVRTIDAIRSSIVDELGAKDPRAAVVRLWQLIDASHTIMEIVDDSSGMTSGSLQGAVADLGRMLQKSGVGDAPALADRVHTSFLDNGYSIKDGLVRAVSPALGLEGRTAMRRLFEEDLAALDAMPAPSGDQGVDYNQQSRRSAAAQGLMDLADAEGDVDAFLRAARWSPNVVAHAGEAAKRLLKARRSAEALLWLDSIPADHGQWRDATGQGLVGLKLRALEALRRKDEAQALRWQMFDRHLWTFYLREYVKRLPDFEDDALIRRAIAHALAYPGVLDALMFLVDWPDLDAAAQLVTTRGRNRRPPLSNPEPRHRPAGGQAPSGNHDPTACQDRQCAGASVLGPVRPRCPRSRSCGSAGAQTQGGERYPDACRLLRRHQDQACAEDELLVEGAGGGSMTGHRFQDFWKEQCEAARGCESRTGSFRLWTT
jgi:hypothetical protein